MKMHLHYSKRYGLIMLCAFTLLSGFCWDLSWGLALPLLTVFCPISMSVLICLFYSNLLFRWKIAVYTMTVIVTEGIRAFCYILLRHGLDYLLRDGETQIISAALIIEQLLLGIITIGILTTLKRHPRNGVG